MRFLIIGSGSIGKRHARNLISLGIPKRDLFAIDTREDRRNEIESVGVSKCYSSLDEALQKENFDAAIMCSPTSLHIPQGISLAKKGIHILMEKPLAHNLEGIDEFIKVVEENKVVILMAYIFRFSPLTKKVKELLDSNAIGKVLYVRGEFSEYLPDWHPYEDYRSYYMAEKTQGGGSILDQSHIMDLVHYLLGGFKSVFAFNSNISSLELNSDDIAEMIVTLKSGVIASIHTDIFGREHKKYLEIKGEEGNIFWDVYANEVRLYNSSRQSVEVFSKFPTDFNLNYLNETKHFIDCCNKEAHPIAPLSEGIETMELILSAERSHSSNKNETIKR
jgi:predicted dehydrogenase